MKTSGVELEFEIRAYEPATMPMSRLAEYMADLAKLLGAEDAVHFVRLKKGSTVIVHRVEGQQFPRVRDRAYTASTPEAPTEVRQAYDRIEKRLRLDNARGARLNVDGAKIFEIKLARTELSAKYPSIGRYGTLQGVVTRIGGKGEWVPVHLEDVDGTIYICEAKKDKTKELARYYLDQPLRVEGQGRWIRREGGGWNLESFRIHDFSPLRDEPVPETIQRLRSIRAEWKDRRDPLAELDAIRHNGHSRPD